VQWQAFDDTRIAFIQLFAEIEALLQIGHAGREFAANRKITAPCTPAPRHGDLHFSFFSKREETPAGSVECGERRIADAVVGGVEETEVTASLADGVCGAPGIGNIDDGKRL